MHVACNANLLAAAEHTSQFQAVVTPCSPCRAIQHNNSISGSVAAGWTLPAGCLSIGLDNNSLTGSIPPLVLPPSLRALSVDGNQLAGGWPTLSLPEGLQYLSFARNPLGGPLPADPALPSSVMVVNAWGCGFTGAGAR